MPVPRLPATPQPESGREKRQRLRAELTARSEEREPPPPQHRDTGAKASPDALQTGRWAWLTWGRFALLFFLTMWGLTTLALAVNERSAADVLAGGPVTAAVETVIVVVVLRLGFWLFSLLRSS